MRTGKDLDFVLEARDAGFDVHVVTQVVLSLVGLVVFPYEAAVKSTEPELANLDNLEPVVVDDVWRVRVGPIYWNQQWHELQEPITTVQLRFGLRNAIAHNNVRFSGDAGSLEDVSVRFVNRQRRSKGLEVNRQWVMDIDGNDLLTFCRGLLPTLPT